MKEIILVIVCLFQIMGKVKKKEKKHPSLWFVLDFPFY